MSSKIKSQIRYSQCWEDADIMLEALDIQPTDVVLSIASGGCNTFSILSRCKQNVYAIDNNPSQIFLSQLKHAAIQKLEYEEYLEFVGIRKSKKRLQYFKLMRDALSNDCNQYFLQNKRMIKQGIIHCGRFEKYLRLFRKFILPLVQTKSIVRGLMWEKSKQEQQEFYSKQWNNWRWRLIGRLFFSKHVMQLLGRHKNMFTYNTSTQVGRVYLFRAEKALSKGIVYENPYMEYVLTGTYKNALPHYLNKKEFLAIKGNNNIRFLSADILRTLKAMPDNRFSKFNLSDVFESLSEQKVNDIFKEIIRTAKNGARIIFWNNLVQRDAPYNLKEYFIEDAALEEELKQKEKVFFYNRFYIYTIKK